MKSKFHQQEERRMTLIIALSRKEIAADIPYELICQTRYGAAWDTGTRRRKWNETFSAEERETAKSIFKQSLKWYTKGLPEEVRMDMDTYRLWHKIAVFCYTF